jgi:AraC-like DNA-binding protein
VDEPTGKAQTRGMRSSLPDLAVDIERGRAALRVAARTREMTPSLVAQITFSGGPDGISFRFHRGAETHLFSREIIARHPAMSALLRLIADEIEITKKPDDALLGLLVRALLAYASRMTTQSPLAKWGRPVRDRRIEKALTLLNADLSKYWTVELLARAVGLSRPQFARQFLSVMRYSPMRYLADRRMKRASELLRDTDAGLAEVAAQVGYRSEFAFSRAFKRHHQAPPSVYRQTPTLGQRAA